MNLIRARKAIGHRRSDPGEFETREAAIHDPNDELSQHLPGPSDLESTRNWAVPDSGHRGALTDGEVENHWGRALHYRQVRNLLSKDRLTSRSKDG